MFKVQLVSACGERHDFWVDLTEGEAIGCCELNDWCYVDANGYVWDLDYVVEDY